ncbi:MAG: type I restriction-modification system endonuclease [Ignavibacteriales bacterium]|nr:type I restriction-modification system endonuclease [Ignavibacteriales bacterium]
MTDQTPEQKARELIDAQLRLAGWEADSQLLRFSRGTRSQRGKYLAIAEWPVGKLIADYALFYEHEFIGLVEAKKFDKDIVSDLRQAIEYSKHAEDIGGVTFLGKWKDYHVPFMFSSNGRKYNQQLELKSGIWFLDGREKSNHPRALRGFFSPQGLKDLLKQDQKASSTFLAQEPYDYLTSIHALNLRPYQIDAIKAVEKKIEEFPEDKRALVAMATGTGKTRTIIGLCYRFIKSKRFKRILFLVDRNILGTQAAGFFSDVVIEDLQTFSRIYDVKEIGEIKPDIDTKLHFSTVQAMVKRIFYNDHEDAIPTIDTYDCIIVDEAHRGYILDKEMTEDEIEIKNEEDYLSKYKMVLDYFDAYKIGMTATPALHTQDIFGSPIYRYTYRQAVLEGYLIDFEPPYTLTTKLSDGGIIWHQGEQPLVYDHETQELNKLDKLEDELKIDIEGFNKDVITEEFNRVVCRELVKHLAPDSKEKTLIFAANDQHADLVVKTLTEEFEKAGIEIDDEAITKITGSVYKPQEALNKFKNERFPNIAVTVDLLTTGVDIEEICNLVFLRRVRSRILYEQMLGRATRRADHIGKEVFKIFDAVKLYEALQDVTDMKPVVVKPEQTFKELIEEIDKIATKEQFKKQIEQIIAKYQRKKKRLERELKEKGSGDYSKLLTSLQNLKQEDAKEFFKDSYFLFKQLDQLKDIPRVQLLSEHKDEILSVERGYGKGKKPQDYLEEFRAFIKAHINDIAALHVLCTRPKDLTRNQLKQLIIELDSAGFTKANLNVAWKETTNQDIAADIIAFIRTYALGSPLISHEDRIKSAIKKIKALKPWNISQLHWFDLFEKQLLKEDLLDREAFNQEPFKTDGGYNRLNKIFENKLDEVINTLGDYLYSQSA